MSVELDRSHTGGRAEIRATTPRSHGGGALFVTMPSAARHTHNNRSCVPACHDLYRHRPLRTMSRTYVEEPLRSHGGKRLPRQVDERERLQLVAALVQSLQSKCVCQQQQATHAWTSSADAAGRHFCSEHNTATTGRLDTHPPELRRARVSGSSLQIHSSQSPTG